MEQFDLLSLVHSSRTKHGIAHADYLRYSRHNTNKIRKTKSEIQSLVFKAERNWAFAMECKKNSLQFPRKRFHGIKKLNRAICHSKKIIEKTSGNERENLTCIAYSLGLEGLACVERKNWEEGVKALSNSRNIYVNLQKSAQSSRHEHYLQVAIDELDPLLKYCAYQLKIKTGMQVNIQDLLDMKRSIGNSGEDDGLEFQLNKLLDEASKATSYDGGIQWRTFSLKTTSSDWLQVWDGLERNRMDLESEMSSFIDFGNKEMVALRQKAFDALLGTLWDASRLVEVQLKEYQMESDKLKSSKSTEKTSNFEAIQGYVLFQRLFYTVRRNLFLIDWCQFKVNNPKVYKDRTKKEEVVKLFNFSIQCLEDMSSITFLEEDPSLGFIIDTHIHSIKGLRSLYIAGVYSNMNKTVEAMALVGRSDEHLKAAKESIFLTKALKDDQELLSAQKAVENLEMKCISERVRISASLSQDSAQLEQNLNRLNLVSKNFLANLDEYPSISENSKLVEIPLVYCPLPFKPLILDLVNDAVTEYKISDLKVKESGDGLIGVIRGFWGAK